MLVETAKDRISIKQMVDKKQEEINVEGDIIVNDIKPDILNIISINGIPYIYKKEVMDGKIRIDGSINTYIIYSANDENNSIRSLNTILDFTHITDIEKVKTGMMLDENIILKDFEYKILNERKINIKATLDFETKIYSNNDFDMITSMKKEEDIQILNQNRTINSLIGEGSTKVYAKDTIHIHETDDLAEIIKVDLKLVNKDIKISYNKVLAKADARVNILYLTEDDIINETTVNIPVVGFVDIENINDNNICDVTYKLKNVIIKPNNTELHTIYVEIQIEVNCLAYEIRDINLIEDIYSIFSEINFTNKEVLAIANKNNIKEQCNVNKSINIPELENNELCNTSINTKILNSKIKQNKIMYECETEIQILFKTSTNMQVRKIKVPFDFETESNMISENSNIETSIETNKENILNTGNGNIEMDLDLDFNISISNNEKLNIIDEVSMEECRQNDLYSMVIYFVKPNDTLWKIAKKFKSTIEDIARVNGIEDVNKINVGQQLYIPKYNKKDIAV